MVRFKRRWLVVQVESANNASTTETKMTRNDLIRTIRENLLHNFGQSATALAAETQVRFWDPETQLALIRTSREGSSHVRATLTLTTTTITTGNNNRQRQHPPRRIAFHILSVHGSTRTCQIAVIRRLRHDYNSRIRLLLQSQDPPPTKRMIEDCCIQLEQQLQSIQQLE